MFSDVYNIKTFFKAEKNAWTCDLNWCNYVGGPAGGLLFNN